MIDREKIIQIFKASPTPTSIIRADAPLFSFIQVNNAYTKMTQRQEEQLLGKPLFEAFPENPDEEKPTGFEKIRNSFEKVIATKKEDELPAIRYDIAIDDGGFTERYFQIVNTPVFDEKGNVEFIVNSATDVTEKILNERHQQLMLNNAEDSFVLIDRDKIIVSFNDAYAEKAKDIFGIVPKVGLPILDLALPERVEKVNKILDQVFGGEIVRTDLSLTNQDGKERFFYITYGPVYNDMGKIYGALSSVYEKTEEHKAKKALEENEARYRTLIENGSDVIFVLSPEAKPIYISPSIENVLGYTQQEAYDMDLMKVVHPDDVSIIHNELKKCMDKPGEPIQVTPARMMHKDGAYRWCEGTITNMLHDPSINGIVDNFRDITDRVEYQQAIEEAKEKYQSLIQTMDGIIWEADARTFIFNYVSPQSKEILGYEPEEWIGKEGFWKSLIHPDDRDEAAEYCHHQTLKGINHTFEYRIKHKNGHYIWLRDIVTVISVDGSPRSLRGLMIDITQEKELEVKLKQTYTLSKIGNWELNLQTEELYWSDYLKALHEVDPDYTPELESAIYFYKEGGNRERIIKAVDKAIQENVSFDLELLIITAKGNERWIRAVGEPEFNQGKCTRLYGSTQDITQRKELELELAHVYKMASIGNWEIDLINKTLYWSDVVKDTFEVEPNFEPNLDSAIEFYTEGENREAITEAVEAAMEYGTQYDIELQITTDKGNKKWVRNIGEAEYRDGNCIRVFGTTQDVTGRKLAELKLLNVNASLTERIKEQACLYEISNLNEQELTIHELLSEAVKMIPSGFLNPVITSSEIVFNGESFTTDGYENHSKKYRLSYEFKRSDNELKITAALEESTQYELRFLDEEDALLKGIAIQLSQKIDQIQKRNELKQAEEKFRNVVEHSTNMFYQHDLDGVLTFVSPQSKAFLGYDPEEAKHKWTEFITGHPINKIGEERTQTAIDTGEVQPPYELQLRKANGQIIWVEVNEAPLIEDGEVIGIVGSLSDISERKQYEEQLQESLERYDIVSKATSDTIWDLDLETDQMLYNKNIHNMFGYTKNQVKNVGTWWHNKIHREDLNNVDKALAEVLKNGEERFQMEYRFKAADGSYKYILDRAFVIKDDNGKAIRMIGAMQDVTQKEEEEERLKLLESVITNTSESIVILNDKTREYGREIIYVNKAFIRLTGYSKDEVLGETLHFLNGPETNPVTREQLKQAMLDHKAIEVEFINYKKNGENFWINTSMVPVQNSKDEYTHWVAIGRDITDKKEREQEIKASLQEKETLLAEIHHRVKNNLAVVSGMMLLQAFDTENESLQAKLYDSVSRIKTMAIVHELLYQSDSFSQLEFSETLRRLVENVSETLETKAKVKLEINCDLVKLNINQAIPASLIVNEVLTNAYKHAFKDKNRGKIEFNLIEENEKIDITIKDNGVGFTEDTNQKNSLGLHLIQVLNDQIEGTYTYEKGDKGTIFTLSFNKKGSKKGIGNAGMN